MSRAQRYILPAAAIIETMKQQRDVVAFRAPLPEGRHLPSALRATPCFAEIVLGNGTLHSCTIFTSGGTLVCEQQEAMRLLQGLGDLEWVLHSLPLSPTPGSPPQTEQTYSASPEMVPRKAPLVGSATPAEPLTHRQRRVWLLIDGQRSVRELASLLCLSPQEIEEALTALARSRLILS